jgi:CheY-like chemotaxis protein
LGPSRRNGHPRPPRIYWAEDDRDDQFLIREAVRGTTPAITFFDDGHALLKSLGHSKPDRVVLDIQMPRLDGIETLKAIRKRPGMRSLPVVMFSTAMIDEEVATCKSLEIQAFVQKPANFDEFAAAVAGIVDGTSEHRAATLGRRQPVRA